jgi:nicotinamidase-related amidase
VRGEFGKANARIPLIGFSRAAQDAYLRDFHLYIPRDCVASRSAEANARALAQMREVLGATIDPSTALDLVGLKQQARSA